MNWREKMQYRCARVGRPGYWGVRSVFALLTVFLTAGVKAQSTDPRPNPGAAEVTSGAEWALGRWDGGVYSIGGAGGVTGGSSMNNRSRSMLISRNSGGTFICRFGRDLSGERSY